MILYNYMGITEYMYIQSHFTLH